MSGSTGSGMKETIKKISSECEYLQSLFIDREARMNQEEAESSSKALEIIEIAETKRQDQCLKRLCCFNLLNIFKSFS